jgi:hypothetical protein
MSINVDKMAMGSLKKFSRSMFEGVVFPFKVNKPLRSIPRHFSSTLLNLRTLTLLQY